MTDVASGTSTSRVSTDRPARYAKQLVAHLGRRQGGEWAAETGTGWIELGGARATVTAQDGILLLQVTTSADDLARMEDVLGRHLVRFGERDELVVAWERADGSPGTRQESDPAPEPEPGTA